VAFVLAAAVWMKFYYHRDVLIRELQHPVSGADVPGAAMAMMVISTSLVSHVAFVGLLLWLISIIFYLTSAYLFIYYRCKYRDFGYILPSWFVPTVGIAAVAVTVPADFVFAHLIAKGLLMVALMWMGIMLPLIQYRLLLGRRIIRQNRATIAILAAPPNICLAGSLTVFEHPPIWLVFMLLGIGLVMTFSVYLSLLTILRQPFTLGFSALTFPAAIGAVSLHKTSAYLDNGQLPYSLVQSIRIISFFELLVSTGVMFYVMYHYAKFFMQQQRYIDG